MDRFLPILKNSNISVQQETNNIYWDNVFNPTTGSTGSTTSTATVNAAGRTTGGSYPSEYLATLDTYLPKPMGIVYHQGDCSKPAFAFSTFLDTFPYDIKIMGTWDATGINTTPNNLSAWESCNSATDSTGFVRIARLCNSTETLTRFIRVNADNTFDDLYYDETNEILLSNIVNNPTDPYVEKEENNNSSILSVVRCDETATGVVDFVKLYYQKYENGALVSTFIGDYTDESGTTPYTVTLEKDCNVVGTELESGQYHRLISGTGTWSPSGLTRQYTVLAISGNPTFTDSGGVTSTLDSSVAQSLSYPASQPDEILDTDVVFNANGGSFEVTYIEFKTI